MNLVGWTKEGFKGYNPKRTWTYANLDRPFRSCIYICICSECVANLDIGLAVSSGTTQTEIHKFVGTARVKIETTTKV